MRRAKAAAAEAEARGEKPKTPEDFMHQQTHGARRPATFFMAAGGHSHKHGEDPASKEAAEKKKKKQQADDMDAVLGVLEGVTESLAAVEANP